MFPTQDDVSNGFCAKIPDKNGFSKRGEKSPLLLSNFLLDLCKWLELDFHCQEMLKWFEMFNPWCFDQSWAVHWSKVKIYLWTFLACNYSSNSNTIRYKNKFKVVTKYLSDLTPVDCPHVHPANSYLCCRLQLSEGAQPSPSSTSTSRCPTIIPPHPSTLRPGIKLITWQLRIMSP